MINYTGLQKRGGPDSKTKILFSKVFRRAESKNDISFGPSHPVLAHRGVIIPNFNRKWQKIAKKNLELTENSR